MDNIILRAQNISKEFPGVKALNSVNLNIYRGQVNTIVGENGAGKSTLMKILSGVCGDYSGELYLENQLVTFRTPKDAQQHGIAIIHQELNLIPNLSVAENIFLGREFQNRIGFIDYNKLHSETAKLLNQLKLDIDPSTPVSDLRVGQQQIIEIAKALSLNARIIIMDEPTSAISDQEVHVLFELINDLITDDVAIVYITHKLDEIFKIGHQVTALRDGQLVDSRPLDGLSHDDLVKMMVGRDVQNFFVKEHSISDEIVLQTQNLSLPYQDHKDQFVLRDINLAVRKGQVLGVFGLMGAGRTELMETLFGLHPKATGELSINSHSIGFSSPEQAIKNGIGFVPEDRKTDGLVLNMTVAQSISLACVDRIKKYGFLSDERENQLAEKFIDSLNIKTPSAQQIIENLSGGNQQKVVLAKWLATDPKILLLDEPTRGIDINAKSEIYKLINELAKSGLAIIMVSSELPEILAIADRIIVLSQGRITGKFNQQEATEEILLKAAIS